MNDAALREPFSRAGILLVLPNGPGRTWHVPGSPGPARDDRTFVHAVVQDVVARWAIPNDRIWIGGMSQGAAMVWDLACRVGGFSAYVAIAGDFWAPLPERCDAGPVDLLQIHGLTDAVFPLEGRAIAGAQQGDLFAGLAVMRQLDGCRSDPDRAESHGRFVVRDWTTCSTAAQMRLMLHTGGHEIPPGWFEVAWPWVRRVGLHGLPVAHLSRTGGAHVATNPAATP